MIILIKHVAFVLSYRDPITSSIRLLNTGERNKYLAILKVNSTSTPKDIKESFLKLSKIYHPDNKLTGSHNKFVELKQAYDALKDGVKPASYTSTNPYDQDLSHRANIRYRDTSRSYTEQGYHDRWGSAQQQANQRKAAWESYANERRYQQTRSDWESFGRRRSHSTATSFTIFLGAIAWVIIYSGVLLIWDYNDAVKKGLSRYSSRSQEDYLAYQEYLKRKELRRIMNLDKNKSKADQE